MLTVWRTKQLLVYLQLPLPSISGLHSVGQDFWGQLGHVPGFPDQLEQAALGTKLHHNGQDDILHGQSDAGLFDTAT